MTRKRLSDVATLQLKDRVRRDIIEFGIGTLSELSARHGVPLPQMSGIRQEIMDNLRKEFKERGYEISSELVAKMDLIYRRAAIAFERSKENAEKTTTTYTPKKCPDCKGSGWQDPELGSGEWCATCDGEGTVLAEVSTRESKGQAGDPTFLRVMLDCVKEIGRLSGQYTHVTQKGGTMINVVSGGVDLSAIKNEKMSSIISQLQSLALGGDREAIDVTCTESDK